MGGIPTRLSKPLVRAPRGTPRQNGIFERVARSLKIALLQLFLDTRAQPSQALIAQVAMERNRFPHTLSREFPPSLAMTGSSDLLAGRAATAWNHDPHSIDPDVRQLNSTPHIFNARNVISAADATRALVSCVDRNLPGRSRECPQIDPIVQIAVRKQWIGCYSEVGRPPNNIIVAKRESCIQVTKIQGAVDGGASRRRPGTCHRSRTTYHR